MPTPPELPHPSTPEPSPDEHQFVPGTLSPATQAWLERMRHAAPPDGYIEGRDALLKHADQQDRRRFWKKAGLVGAATLTAAAIGAGMTFNGGNEQASGPETPRELELGGNLDMTKVIGSLRSIDYELAQKDKTQELGMAVVPLMEYTLTAGYRNKDGVAVMEDPQTPSVPHDFRETLDSVIAANATTLNYLADTEQVETIRFSVATDPADMNGQVLGDMRFAPERHDEYDKNDVAPAHVNYVLPPDQKVSAQAAATMLGHELNHAIGQSVGLTGTRELSLAPEHLASPDIQAYARDLADVRAASIAAAEATPEVQDAARQVIEVNKTDSGPLARVQTEIAQSILNGTFNDRQPTAEHPSKIGDIKLPEGRINLPSFVQEYDAGLSNEIKDAVTPAQRESRAILDRTFEDAMYNSPDSPLSAFKESNFIEANDRYGHPHGDAGELTVSSLNTMRFFPRQVAEKLKKLPPKAKQASLRLLNRFSKDVLSVTSKYGNSTDFDQELQRAVDYVTKEAA